ncbi:unnamed protein product [Pleuronectes platessa]|uniref:Uncharacterized protein n=1 Tax=Pleuronectes platessa TaxID=8262 RepID=A0A9N7YS21_PLEPL|nr:unnamed protein product [Pleuronectes platessa]
MEFKFTDWLQTGVSRGTGEGSLNPPLQRLQERLNTGGAECSSHSLSDGVRKSLHTDIFSSYHHFQHLGHTGCMNGTGPEDVQNGFIPETCLAAPPQARSRHAPCVRKQQTCARRSRLALYTNPV